MTKDNLTLEVLEAKDSIKLNKDGALDIVKLRQVLALYKERGGKLITNPAAEDALYAMLVIKKDITKLLKMAGDKLIEEGIKSMGEEFNGADGKKVQVAYLAKTDFECENIGDIDPRFVRESLNKNRDQEVCCREWDTAKGYYFCR